MLFRGDVGTATTGDVGVMGNASRMGVVDMFELEEGFLARKGFVSEEDEDDSGSTREGVGSSNGDAISGTEDISVYSTRGWWDVDRGKGEIWLTSTEYCYFCGREVHYSDFRDAELKR